VAKADSLSIEEVWQLLEHKRANDLKKVAI
jgi:hypothetical protein